MGNREEALDITQEAFARAFKAVARFDLSRPFYPWLYQILRNLCFNWLRKASTRRTVSLSPAVPDDEASPTPELPDARFDPNALASQTEQNAAVWQAIGQLSQRDREIIILNHFQMLSYQEIAGVLDIPIGTVMSRLYYARGRLRERLADYMAKDSHP